MQCSLREMRYKEVISVTDGSRYGYVGDVDIDLDSGQVRALIIPGQPRFFGLRCRGRRCAALARISFWWRARPYAACRKRQKGIAVSSAVEKSFFQNKKTVAN